MPFNPTGRPRGVTLTAAVLLGAAATLAAATGQNEASDPRAFLQATLTLSSRDASALDQGRAVVKTLAATSKRDVTTAGAVRIEGSAAEFVGHYRTLDGFRKSQFVQQIARFSDPPRAADLDPLIVDKDDIDALRACRAGSCEVRLPADDMRRFAGVDWQAPAAAAETTALYKGLLLKYLDDYRKGGIERLLQYDDQKATVRLADETRALLLQEPSPLDADPGFRAYLIGYPNGSLPRTEDFFYWSKEKFGFKPVIGLNHVSVHTSDRGQVTIVTTQIYASHYMDGQTAVTALFPDPGADEAFYWLYFNRARIDRLDGVLGFFSRPIVQRRARSGLARSLNDTKRRLEAAR